MHNDLDAGHVVTLVETRLALGFLDLEKCNAVDRTSTAVKDLSISLLVFH